MRHIKVPVITGIYDLLSGKCDGTVTPQAPIIVSGSNLNMLDVGDIRLCLVPAADNQRIIEIHIVYKYSHDRVIVSLPELSLGKYSPAVIIVKPDADKDIYVFPISWMVTRESCDRVFSYPCCTKIEE